MCKSLGIDIYKRIKTLSKGTKEKVQLVLVMARKAQLYLLDEPIAGVDPAARDFVLDTILTNYNEEGTVLLSTHLISDIEQILDEVIFLKEGKVMRQQTVDDIREQEGKSVDALFRAQKMEGGDGLMLLKLVKYDCRAMMKQFGLLWPAAIVVGLLTRFAMPSYINENGGLTFTNPSTAAIIGLITLAVTIIAMFVLTVVFIVTRYNKSLLGDEGYLMHTLPVAPWQLVASKLICGMVTVLVSGVVAFVTVLLIATLSAAQLWNDEIWQLIRNAFLSDAHFYLQSALYVVSFIAGVGQEILLLYASLSVGHLVSKGKVLISGIAYIAGSVSLSMIRSHLGVSPSVSSGVTSSQTYVNGVVGSVNVAIPDYATNMSNLVIRLAFTIVIGVICFAIANYILKRKLNLE